MNENGTAFVNYKNFEDAKRAIDEANKKLKLEGDQVVMVVRHFPKAEKELNQQNN